jgi:hypothetical protein
MQFAQMSLLAALVLSVGNSTAYTQPTAPAKNDQTPGETRIDLDVPQTSLATATAFLFVFSGDQTSTVVGGSSVGANPFISAVGSRVRSAQSRVDYDRNATTLTISGNAGVAKGAVGAKHNVGYIYTGDYREVTKVAWLGGGRTIDVADIACKFSYDPSKQVVRVIAMNKSSETVKVSGAAFSVVDKFPALGDLTDKNFPASRLKEAPTFNIELAPGQQTPPLEVSMRPDEFIVSRARIDFAGKSTALPFAKAGASNLSLWAFRPIGR